MQIESTRIQDLLVVRLDVHEDSRGWFKENWQRKKMVGQGLPDFRPVQNNISFNRNAGATRGLHAEPWDKYVSVANGRVFGAWCDLREGSSTYGETFTIEIDPSIAVFVPRGVANGFQALEDNTSYSYLVNDHWKPDAEYSFVNLNLIDWPLVPTEVSEKDKNHPTLEDAIPVSAKKTLVLGRGGQLSDALERIMPQATYLTRDEFDISDPPKFNWADYDTIVNAAAYTAVDQAEIDIANAWKVNATGVGKLAKICDEHDLTLVHVSSDYVFDGSKDEWLETDDFCPLGVYGQSKAAGDITASQVRKHYIVRTSWVVGSGKNFVSTMRSLAQKGVKPAVVDDQVGRLSFTEDIASGIVHLLRTNAEFGTYNLTNTGRSVSWAQIAKKVFEMSGADPADVTPVSTEAYFGENSHAPRPSQSTLNLSKIGKVGFVPRDWENALEDYLKGGLR